MDTDASSDRQQRVALRVQYQDPSTLLPGAARSRLLARLRVYHAHLSCKRSRLERLLRTTRFLGVLCRRIFAAEPLLDAPKLLVRVVHKAAVPFNTFYRL